MFTPGQNKGPYLETKYLDEIGPVGQESFVKGVAERVGIDLTSTQARVAAQFALSGLDLGGPATSQWGECEKRMTGQYAA